MSKSEISIIVATKNRPDFLFRCLLAIWRSRFHNFECIVVSDHCNYAKGVMNDTPFRYDKRFILEENWSTGGILNQKNAGAISKNIGVDMARSNKICYCDDDNIIFDFHLGTFIGMNDEYTVGYSRFIDVLWHNRRISDILDNDLYFEGGLRWNGDVVENKEGTKDNLAMCHTKDVWNKIGGWKTWAELPDRNEDRDFMIRIGENVDRVERYDSVTAIYNQHSLNEDETKKDGEEYEYLLSEMKDRYVYPHLIKGLKNEYGIY